MSMKTIQVLESDSIRYKDTAIRSSKTQTQSAFVQMQSVSVPNIMALFLDSDVPQACLLLGGTPSPSDVLFLFHLSLSRLYT